MPAAASLSAAIGHGPRPEASLSHRGTVEIPRAGGQAEQIAVQIQILEKVVAWHKRCKPCVEGKVQIEQVQKQLKEWRKQLGDLRKKSNDNGGG